MNFLSSEQDRILEYVVSSIPFALESERCTLFLQDRKQRNIYSLFATGLETPLEISLDSGIAGDVARTGEIACVRDVGQDSRFDPSVDSRTGFETRSVLAVPIKQADGATFGVLEVLNKERGNFSMLDGELLEAFAALVGTALKDGFQRQELKRAYTGLIRRQRQMDLLYDFEQALADDENASSCIERALEMVREALNAEGASILLCTESKEKLEFSWVTEGSSSGLKGMTLDAGEGIASQVMQSGQPRQVKSVPVDPSFSAKADQVSGIETRDMIAFPLISAERTEGVLEEINSQHGGFDSDDIQLGQILAEGLAQSICRLRALEKRRQASRLASVGRMTSSIIHDLRNPLTIIAGYTSMLDPEDPESIVEASRIIQRQVDRSKALMNDLLEFCSGKQNLEKQTLDVREFVETLGQNLKEDLAQTNLKTGVSVSASGQFLGDPAKLDRLFCNLASNSRGAMPDGGNFTVDCSDQGEGFLFRVADDGPGVPEVVRAKLFEPFVTHGKRDGTGLGLSIIRGVIEAHGGTIELGDGPGAVFLIELPRAIADRSQ